MCPELSYTKVILIVKRKKNWISFQIFNILTIWLANAERPFKSSCNDSLDICGCMNLNQMCVYVMRFSHVQNLSCEKLRNTWNHNNSPILLDCQQVEGEYLYLFIIECNPLAITQMHIIFQVSFSMIDYVIPSLPTSFRIIIFLFFPSPSCPMLSCFITFSVLEEVTIQR